jgi:translation initiation factor IF-2
MAKAKHIGKVTHVYGNINVAVVALCSILKKGDKIKIGKTDFFNQSVRSMQLNKERVEVARKGKEVGLRVYKKVRVGDHIFKR